MNSFFSALWDGLSPVLSVIGSAEFLYSVLRLSTPILLATMAALISDRAGVTNIAIEGTMLFAALMGVVGSAAAQSSWIGLLVAIASGMLFSLLLAFFHLRLRTNLVLTCIALNSMSSGLTVFILFLLTGDRGVSTALRSVDLPRISIPLLEDIPFVRDVLSGQNVLTYMAIAVVVLVAILLYKTRLGTYIRAVGENPQAVATAGYPADRIRFYALLISGAIAGHGRRVYVHGLCQRLYQGHGFRARLHRSGRRGDGARQAPALLAGGAAVWLYGFSCQQPSGAGALQRPCPHVPLCDHHYCAFNLRMAFFRAQGRCAGVGQRSADARP